MIYLAAQFAWFLLAAFALGLAMGWISHDGGRLRLGGPLVLGLAGAWALGGALTWTQTLNGTAALWVESALLFIAVYALGCILGSVICAWSSLQAAPAGASPAMTGAGEEQIPGRRPPGLPAAQAAGPDDLKLISGIGAQNEARLRALGVWHFSQIAEWDDDNVAWVGSYLAFPGRIEREDWVGQARRLAAGEEAEFARRARAGLVPTSRSEEAG